MRRASHAGSHDSVPEKDRQRTLVEEWRSYRQTEVSRLSAGSVDNIPSRPGTYNGVLSTKALLLFVQERNKTCNLTLINGLCSCPNKLLFVSYFALVYVVLQSPE